MVDLTGVRSVMADIAGVTLGMVEVPGVRSVTVDMLGILVFCYSSQ